MAKGNLPRVCAPSTGSTTFHIAYLLEVQDTTQPHPFSSHTAPKLWHPREVGQQKPGKVAGSTSYPDTNNLSWVAITCTNALGEDNSRPPGSLAWTSGFEERIITTPTSPTTHFHCCEGGWLHNLDFKCQQGSNFYGMREKMLQLLLVLST